MKTLATKISSESNSQNYDINGKENGQNNSLNYRIVVQEDNTEVGSVNISVNTSYYNNMTDEDFASAKTSFEEKIKQVVESIKSYIQQ